jgi:hypothetical protein
MSNFVYAFHDIIIIFFCNWVGPYVYTCACVPIFPKVTPFSRQFQENFHGYFHKILSSFLERFTYLDS